MGNFCSYNPCSSDKKESVKVIQEIDYTTIPIKTKKKLPTIYENSQI